MKLIIFYLPLMLTTTWEVIFKKLAIGKRGYLFKYAYYLIPPGFLLLIYRPTPQQMGLTFDFHPLFTSLSVVIGFFLYIIARRIVAYGHYLYELAHHFRHDQDCDAEDHDMEIPLSRFYWGAGFTMSKTFDFTERYFLIPFIEELAGRGIVYVLFRMFLPIPIAMLLSGLLFSLGHYTNSINRSALAHYVVFGIVYAALFEITGSLLAPSLCHTGFNLTEYLFDSISAWARQKGKRISWITYFPCPPKFQTYFQKVSRENLSAQNQ
ncbi:MAG: CPBP family intramembrane metalloprotease [Elusimicrobia bacterium]|nr:CPBP family intramembrane metalloprotease [Elusimicrobiota bacterium]